MGGWRNRGGETQGGLLSCTSTYANYSARLFAVFCEETMYTDPAPFQRAVRGRRGDDVHAERCPRVGRDPTLLRSVLGFHVVDSVLFAKSRNYPLTPRKGCSGSSSPTRRPCAILAGTRPCHCPRTSPPTPRRARNTIPSAPARAPGPTVGAPVTFYIPTRPSCWRAAPPRDPTSRRLETHA